MIPTFFLKQARLLEIRPTSFLCEVGRRTLEIPLDEVWNEEELVTVGALCQIEVSIRWAKANGLSL